MWRWDQSAGELSRDGSFISKGYSGNGRGVNNPALQGVAGVGPVPTGKWKIVELRLTGAATGPYTIVIHKADSTPNDDFDDVTRRGAFRIHGDNVKGDNSASHGCIILPRAVRERIWNSKDRDLEVVA